MVRRLAVHVLALALLAASAAEAQPRRADLVEQGISLREQGRDAEALALFEQAYAESPTPRTLAQIALAEQALGRLVEAEAHLAEALAAEDAFIRRNRALLQQAVDEIRRGVGDLSVVGDVEGAEVVIDGQALGVLPLDAPLRVVAGSVRLLVRAAGYEPFETTVTVPGGGAASVSATLVPLARAAVDEGEAPLVTTSTPGGDGGPGWALPLGAALAGAGAVGLGVGIGLMVVREDNAQLRQRCSDTDPACRAAYQTALDAEAGGIAGFVLGGALAAAGATVLVLGATGALGSAGDDAGSGESVRVVCAPGPLSLGCVGTF
jgi:tetratricopeptide (TPR) repeat protein